MRPSFEFPCLDCFVGEPHVCPLLHRPDVQRRAYQILTHGHEFDEFKNEVVLRAAGIGSLTHE